MQYSKIILAISLIIMVVCLGIATVCSIISVFPSEVTISLISAGTMPSLVAILSYYKKSLQENVIKLYTQAYKDIIELNPEADDISSRIEESLLDKIDVTTEEHLADTTNVSIEDVKNIIGG